MMGLLTPHRVTGWPNGEPETACRLRLVDGRVRFEFMFVSPVALIGNARDGWTDIAGATEQFLEWSPDRETWTQRDFETSHEVARADGSTENWSISRHPVAGPQFARLGVHYHKKHRNWL